MLYTVGHRANYLQAIEDSKEGFIEKLGRLQPGECGQFPDGYAGGCVAQTIEDARRIIQECFADRAAEFAVFGIDAQWGVDTAQGEHWWHDLLISKRIIVLEEDNE